MYIAMFKDIEAMGTERLKEWRRLRRIFLLVYLQADCTTSKGPYHHQCCFNPRSYLVAAPHIWLSLKTGRPKIYLMVDHHFPYQD